MERPVLGASRTTMRTLLAFLVVVASTGVAAASPPITVYLDRDGEVQSAHAGEDTVTIPKFGGGDRTWNAVVSCVRAHYAPFAITFVERRPASGTYITAVVGGWASQLGLDDGTTNGVGPYDGSVIPDAVVHVFSQVGTGERDIENLCAVTAHEVGHALGLDHEVLCGDIMSYYLDQCGARTFVDVDAPCGEDGPRACGSGEDSQSSYRRLGRNVGWRDGGPEARRPAVIDAPRGDPWNGGANDEPADPDDTRDDDADADDKPVGGDASRPDPWANDDAQVEPMQYDEIRPTQHAQRGTTVVRVRWVRRHIRHHS